MTTPHTPSPSKIYSGFKIFLLLTPGSEKTSSSFPPCLASFNQPSLCQAVGWARGIQLKEFLSARVGRCAEVGELGSGRLPGRGGTS